MIHHNGMRVGVIFSSSSDRGNKIVKFLGYGKYEGDVPCPFLDGSPNPKLVLDNGTIVWGCQCWWGPEDRIRAQIAQYESAGYKIELIDFPKEQNDEVPSQG
jgi:hypothetical protein